MNKFYLALAFALGAIPIAALADDTSGPPQPTPQQRQAMQQTFERFGQQEEQLHQQLRFTVLSTLSPVHRRAVAATVGELAISPNPDFDAAAKRLDYMLSPGEQQRILAAHASFRAQSRQLHDQMRSELQSEMPAGHSQWMQHGQRSAATPDHHFDAGTVVLMTLSPHPTMMGWPGGPGMHVEGAPPQ
jgi:hypothetical protein